MLFADTSKTLLHTLGETVLIIIITLT